MSASETLLVYDRIAANRRNTLLLLPVFAALLMPLMYGLAQLLVPFFFYNIMMARADAVQVAGSTEGVTFRIVLALIIGSSVAAAGYFASTYFVLWFADGDRVDRQKEPLLCRTVENLCLGAGLPTPHVCVVESSTPNAFSTGRDPKRASLVVTRGLLRLLDERELRGVIAHELSHIGNGDTDLSSLLAALVATLRLPLGAVKAVTEAASNSGAIGGFLLGGVLFWVIVVAVVASSLQLHPGDVMSLNGRVIMMLVALLYAFFIAPAAGMFVRQTVFHQREFLADADAALLTRDPEGLALALAKVRAATGSTVDGRVATAHLYFVDSLPRTSSWWDHHFPSHPAVDKRIELLARMGDGIADRTLSSAAAKGFDYASQRLFEEMRQSPEWSRTTGAASGACVPGARLRLTDSRTELHKSAEQSSPVLADLDGNLLVTVVDLQPHSIHVRLGDGTDGYIRLLAGLEPFDDDRSGIQDVTAENIKGIHYRAESPSAAVPGTLLRVAGTRYRLTDDSTPLYAEPDGWSDVVQHLASGTVVTFNEVVGAFARVGTNGAVGYIPTSAHVARTDTA